MRVKGSNMESEESARSLNDMDDAAFVAFVQELNELACDATGDECLVLAYPFRYVNYGNIRLIECLGQDIWCSESSEWDEEEETLRKHILKKIDTFLISLGKLSRMYAPCS